MRVNDDPPARRLAVVRHHVGGARTAASTWSGTTPATTRAATTRELYYSFSERRRRDLVGERSRCQPPFDRTLGWPQQNKIGDYYDMVSDAVGADLAYAATFNGEQDVYYLRIGDYDCNGNGVGDSSTSPSGTSPISTATASPTSATPNAIFFDGFESGDTAAWSAWVG